MDHFGEPIEFVLQLPKIVEGFELIDQCAGGFRLGVPPQERAQGWKLKDVERLMVHNS